LTFYLAIKGLTAALPVVKEGGTLILAAECAEGLGGAEFRRLVREAPDWRTFLERILHDSVVIDQWQLEECIKAVKRAEVLLYAEGISPEDKRAMFVRSIPSVEEAIAQSLHKHGEGATIAVIPKGPYTLVQVES
jgi:nickel-dependent lactate racemase